MAKPTTLSHLRFPLDGILGNTGNVRVLRALCTYGGPLSTTQLANETHMTPQGVRLVLDALQAYSIVEVLGQGRSQLYQRRSEHPWAAPLQAIFGAEKAQWENLLTAVRQLLDNNDAVVAAWLYGSAARGEDRARSDIDFAVLLKSAAAESQVREAFESLENELYAKFSVVCVTEADLKAGKVGAPWWGNVLREGMQLKGEPRDAPGFFSSLRKKKPTVA
jgi:predicted nucleotidyltransferase